MTQQTAKQPSTAPMQAVELTRLLSSSDISEPGYYWWLPLCEAQHPDKPESWSIISWHPKNPQRQKSGFFYGPLKPPVFSGL